MVYSVYQYLNLLLVLIGLSVQYMVTPSLFWEFNNYEIGVTSILLIFYCIFYFYENLTSSYTYHFFCMGLTFYLTSSCLIFLTGNTQLVFFTEPIFLDIWILNSLFFILFQVLQPNGLNRRKLKTAPTLDTRKFSASTSCPLLET